MAKEKAEEVIEEEVGVVEGAEEEVEVELSPVEQEATAQGWVPKEAWVEQGNSPDDWRPAKEFKERGELFKSIHSIKRELKSKDAALTALQRHHQFVFEKAHQKALTDLKQTKRQAMKEGDLELVAAADERIEALNEEHEQEKKEIVSATPDASAQPHPEFQVWIDRNSWYAEDADLQEFADAMGLVYSNKNPGVNPKQVLAHVETEVRRKFPEKFGPVKRSAPNPTLKPSSTGKVVKRGSDVELSDVERQIMATLVKGGVLTEEQYKADLKKVRS